MSVHYYDCSHIEHVCALYFVHIWWYFGIVELRHFYIYTTFGVLTLFICVQSAIQTDSIPLYKTLHSDCSPIEDWTDDAGPEQSLSSSA